MTENTIINLLLIDRIDAVTQQLRNGGFIVQAERLEQTADVQAYIGNKPLDLIMIRPQADLPSLMAIRDYLETAGRSVPVIALVSDDDSVNMNDIVHAGIDTLCDPGDTDQLLKAVTKELDYLRLRAQADAFEVKVADAEQRSRSILDNAREAIAYIHEGVHMYANPAYVELFGYANADDLEGITLMDMVSSDDRNQVKRFLRDSMKQNQQLEPLTLSGLRTDGSEIPVVMRCQSTRIDDEPCLQIFVNNDQSAGDGGKTVTESSHDPLTKLYNRGFFVDYLDTRLNDIKKKYQGAVMYILLEAFRPLNNRFGLAAGDALVADLAAKLPGLFDEHDVLARLGDGVFAALLPDANRKTLQQLGETLCQTIKSNAAYLDQSLLTTNASIGVCLLDDDYKDALELISRADQACEQVRRKGGNGVFIHADSGAEQAKDESAVDEEAVSIIHEAITAERMRLLYQPIVSFADDSDERYQVVMQILDEQQKPLDMDRLLPVAERTNLTLPLDKWTIISGLSALTERYQEHQTLAHLFIRISGNALHDKDFPSWLEKRLSDTGLSGNVLVIEVLEAVAEKYFKEAKPFREQLRAMGCGFALANFGGKANSERILNHLTPDYVKLDSELIEKRAKSKDESGREAMTNLAQQAQAMQAQVVASGIANANQMASIWQFGVTLVQGDMVREPDTEMAFDFAEFAA